jgi:hypothetical protein
MTEAITQRDRAELHRLLDQVLDEKPMLHDRLRGDLLLMNGYQSISLAPDGEPELQRLERVAYHEAGHAVAGVVLKVAIRDVSVEPRDDSDGRVTSRGPGRALAEAIDTGYFTLAQRARVEDLIVISFAGRVAEEARWSNYTAVGWDDDYGKAVDLACKVTQDDEAAGHYCGWLLVRTRRLIAQPWHWAGVEALADELLMHQRLSGRRARAVIQAAQDRWLQQKRQSHPVFGIE